MSIALDATRASVAPLSRVLGCRRCATGGGTASGPRALPSLHRAQLEDARATLRDDGSSLPRRRLTGGDPAGRTALAYAVTTHSRRRGGRVAEGGGLLNRCRALKPYRGFESHPLRHSASR